MGTFARQTSGALAFILIVSSTACKGTAQSPDEVEYPKFEDYAVEIFDGDRPELVQSETVRYFALAYKNAYSEPINFAGHYILSHKSAQYASFPPLFTSIAIDAQTGRAVDIGYEGMSDPEDRSYDRTYDCPTAFRDAFGNPVKDAVDHRPDSRLLRTSGLSEGGECHITFYEMKDNELHLIRRYILGTVK